MKSEVFAIRVSRTKQLSVNLTISAKERMLSNLKLSSDSVHHISKSRMTINSYAMILTVLKKNNRVKLEMLREHSIKLTLEISLTTTLVRQSLNKLREPKVLRLLIREFLNHIIERKRVLSPTKNTINSFTRINTLCNTPFTHDLTTISIKTIALMDALSNKSRHRVKDINSAIFYLPMLLLILTTFFSNNILIIRIVIKIVIVNRRTLSSSKVALREILSNAKALIHGKDISSKIHDSIPVGKDEVSLKTTILSILIRIPISLSVKYRLNLVNKTVDTNSFNNLLS